jgi:GMP synthase (glutamine-hydrolysing)
MSMTGTVLVVQPVACETLGTIEWALQTHGLTHRYVRIHQADEVPADLGDAAGLIVMGGPMSVYDHGRLSHLMQEMRVMESALKSGRPVLGVCLGSQLLAHVLGAKVYPGPQKEIGWHSVSVLLAAKPDATWAAAPDAFVGLHWHGDVFDLPTGATQLASSHLTACQVFRFGHSAYGILFHMEATASQIDQMAAAFPDELQQSGGNLAELRQGADRHLSQLTRIGQSIFGGWSQLVANTAQATS